MTDEAAGEPSPSESHLNVDPDPARFPDDDQVSHLLRRVDHYVGVGEQALVFVLLGLVVFVASLAAIHDKLTTDHLGRWWHYIVRGGTFAIAMFAATFATQEQRHLAMDLVSRRLTPRGRLILGLALKALTIVIAGLLFKSGLHQRDVAGGNESITLFGMKINDTDIVTTISIGAVLIIFHTVIHMIIDIDYLARGKTPPERMRSGH